MSRLKAFLSHAFAFEKPENSPRGRRFAEAVCEKARAYHLEFPLVVFLEGIRPLSRVAASVLVGLEPAAELFFPAAAYREFIGFIEERENIEEMIAMLEKPAPRR